MSAGDAGDPAGQEGHHDDQGSSRDTPQPGSTPPDGEPQLGQPPTGSFGPPGARELYGQPGYGQSGSGGIYSQPGAYSQPDPYGQPGWMAPRPTNSLAIAALCCGIAQIIAGPLSGIPAIILGFMSVGQIERSGEQGRGMAITGLVLGIVGTILFIVVILVFVAAYQDVQSNGLG